MRFYLQAGFAEVADTVQIARAAESAGFDGLSVADHVFFPTAPVTAYPYTADGTLPFSARDTCWPDPWVLIAVLGSMTTTLRFLTRVYLLPLYNPLLVARAVATAAGFAPGRIRLGIGVGWQPEEFAALGQPFRDRGARTEETMAILREVWGSGALEARAGAHFTFPALTMNPTPPVPIPILVGGDSEAARDRAARVGDGYLPMPRSLEELLVVTADMRSRLRHYGRDPSGFEINVRSLDRNDVEGFAQLATAGVSSVCVAIVTNDAPLAEKLEAIHEFSQRVLRPFHARLGAAET